MHAVEPSSTHDVRHSFAGTSGSHSTTGQRGALAASFDAASVAATAAATAVDTIAWERAFDGGPSAARITAAEQICNFAESSHPQPFSVLLRSAFIDMNDDVLEWSDDEGVAARGIAMMVQGLAAMLAVSHALPNAH